MKGDNVISSKCCGAPIEYHVTVYARCSECRREVRP